MAKMRSKVLSQFPLVLLTLISIIQALALELMWTKIISADYLGDFSLSTIVTWGMISVTLMGILQLWITYSTLVIGFTWRPGISDSIIPFVIGLQEFLMINLISESFNVLWLYVLASLFIVGNWVAHTTFKRARLESENDGFFQGRQAASLKDFTGAIVIIALLVIFGMVITVVENSDWLALIAILIANAALIYQMINSNRLWKDIMAVDD